ncbi:sulfite exporter TauE/SafE family protein [Candidatus Obscuribacterales bacterium]|nr:sulfite exporter TauE/SafE family protein [Candidatus Obscuribacterales bacterium]
MHDPFTWVVGVVAAIAGAVASVAGFGIGSIVTPVMSLQVDTKLAVAAVSIPHFIGSAIRCWSLRKDIDRKILLSFGITSALGGFGGAAIYSWIQAPPLTFVFGVILIFAGTMGITRLNEKLRFHGSSAWIAGAISGGLGGLVGNQGGIRSAALLGFELNKSAFVATATAIGLFVDTARMPVYFLSQMNNIIHIWPLVLAGSIGVVVGTLIGMRLLHSIDERTFKRVVSAVILALGVWMLIQSLR